MPPVERNNFGTFVVRRGEYTFYLTPDGRVMRQVFSKPDRFGFRTPLRRVAGDSAFARQVKAAIIAAMEAA